MCPYFYFAFRISNEKYSFILLMFYLFFCFAFKLLSHTDLEINIFCSQKFDKVQVSKSKSVF